MRVRSCVNENVIVPRHDEVRADAVNGQVANSGHQSPRSTRIEHEFFEVHVETTTADAHGRSISRKIVSLIA